MPEYQRVKDKVTGAHYTVTHVDPTRHEVLKDHSAVDRLGRPLGPKHNITPKAPPKPDSEDGAAVTGAAVTGAADTGATGQGATKKKETSR